MSLSSLVFSQPTPEAERMGVYVLAAVFGLLVCGLVGIAKELREEARSRP
jgi:hypothetical protein